MINTDLILKSLTNQFSLKDRGLFLRDGICPQCAKKSLFIEKAQPFNLKCGRLNKCGYSIKTRELYPDAFQTIEQQYPSTPTDPNATAHAYMKHWRGFNLDLVRELYEQGNRYENLAIGDVKGTDTVRFYLDTERTRYWERFFTSIRMECGEKKAHFAGTRKSDGTIYKGEWWKAPFTQIAGTVYLVEGIFDALSLVQSGHNAVALFSCNNYPTHAIANYLGQGIHWRIALDGDKAGKEYALKHYKTLKDQGENVELLLLEPTQDGKKEDWNDLLKRFNGKIPQKIIDQAVYNGSLLTATSAQQKALIMVDRKRDLGQTKTRFSFEFGKRLYWAEWRDMTDDSDDQAAKEPIKITKISNCYPQFIYFQKSILTGDAEYYIRVERPSSGRIYQEAISTSAITASGQFKDALTKVGAGLLYFGNTQQLDDYLDTHWFPTPTPTEIDTVEFIGYAKEFDCWIFKDQAIIGGELVNANEYDYFKLPDGRAVKTTYRSDAIKLTTNHNPDLWLPDFKTAYGIKGIVTLAWWLGSYFVEHIRAELDRYPWLELSGEPGTGKTGILKFLWKLSGRNNYEGVELSKASHAGRWRTLEQAANLPIVLMEGDRSKDAQGKQAKGFDLNEAKGTYNGRGMRITGVRNGGNDTREPPFRGALALAQNAAIESEPAVMERIIRTHWDKSHFSDAGYNASNRLELLDMNEINGFMTTACTQVEAIMGEYRERVAQHFATLNHKDLINIRIRENSAQIMTLIDLLSEYGLAPLSESEIRAAHEFLESYTFERTKLIQDDPAELQEFWEAYEYLQSTSNIPIINHSRDDAFIAINLNHFESVANDKRVSTAPKAVLKKLLPITKRHKFVDQKAVNSGITNSTIRCYVFSKKEGKD